VSQFSRAFRFAQTAAGRWDLFAHNAIV